MPSVPYANTLRVVCHQTFFGEESINVHHLIVPPAYVLNAANAGFIAGDFQIFYGNDSGAAVGSRGIDDFRPIPAVLDRISVYDLRTVPNPPPFDIASSLAGNAAAENVPWDVAATLTLLTAVGTRSGRGRIFLGPLGGTAVAVSTASLPPQFGLTFNNAVRAAYLDLAGRLAVLAGGPVEPAVLSVVDGVSRVVTAVRMDFRPDTQRRRDLSLSFPAPLTTVIP